MGWMDYATQNLPTSNTPWENLSSAEKQRYLESTYIHDMAGYKKGEDTKQKDEALAGKGRGTLFGTTGLYRSDLDKFANLTPQQLQQMSNDLNLSPQQRDFYKKVLSYRQEQAKDPSQLEHEASVASASDKLKAFADQMMGPLDVNDPYVKQVIQSASGAAQHSANLRGVGGGYATANVESAALRAGNQVQMQRNQLGAQALGQAGQLDMAQAELAQRAYQQQYLANLQGMQAQNSNNQALGSLIGAGVGAIGSYFGVPGLNMQSGAQFGGGIGGLAGGGAPSMQYQPPALGTSQQYASSSGGSQMPSYPSPAPMPNYNKGYV